MKVTMNPKNILLALWLEDMVSNLELKKFVSKEDYKGYMKIKAALEVFVEIERPLDATFKSIKAKIKAKSRKKNKITNLYSKTSIL